MLQLYASLCVKLNDNLLVEQCGVQISDHVNKRCRIRVEMCLPENGPEVNARQRLGEVVRLSVHIMQRANGNVVGPAIVSLEGPIVESLVSAEPHEVATWAFVVEQGEDE